VHWLLAVHTPSPDAQGQSTVQVRLAAVPQTGLSVHTASLVDVPALVRVWLLLHVVQAVHMAVLAAVVKPDVQAVQVRSLVVLPATVEYPAAQLDQLSQLMELAAVLKVPLTQSTQVRSLVAVAPLRIFLPAAQLVSAVHTRSAVKLVAGATDSY